MDCLPGAAGKNLFPVGRLDLDTEGLLLITNDGELAHRLLTPAAHVPKTYYAELDRPAEPEDCLAMESGIVLEDGTRFLPAACRILPEKEGRAVLLTIEEGKFHQVKRMWASRSKTVVYLKRLSMGPLSLGTDLKPGEYRKLTGEEIDCLKGIKEHVS